MASENQLINGHEDPIWFVAHARPRCEKKLESFLSREGIHSCLPTLPRVHKYRSKTVTFHKPLFPGYVFLQARPQERQKIYQSDYVANLLNVPDQTEFELQLRDILLALESEMEIQLAPEIGEGTRVLIRSGPLRGMDAWVETRYGMTTVLLRLDFIGQAAAVKIEADCLELA